MDSVPGHAQGGFASAASGAVHSAFSPPGSDNLEGLLGTGLPGPARRERITILSAMVQRFDRDARARG